MSDDAPEEPTWFDRAVALVKEIGDQGMEHPSTQNVLIGAALGFMVGTTVWESLGFLWGAFLGAALGVAYELDQEDKRDKLDKPDEPGD